MKNLVSRLLSAAFSGVIFISSLSGCSGLERKAGLFYQEKNSLLEIASQRDGVSEYGWEYQTMNLVYKEDKEGFWQSPFITLEKGSGDCEDFATLSAFYSGDKYGNNIMVLAGNELQDGKEIGNSSYHAVHLLINVREIKLQPSGCRSCKTTSDFSEHPKVAQTADFSPQNTQRLFDGMKFGARGYSGDSVSLKNSLREVVAEIQERRKETVKYDFIAIVNLDEMNKNWRTTKENMSMDYLRLLKEEKARIIFVKNLK